ncbi:GSDA3 protein, partial [Todus mexicanus]|nr:GSDA3 protein [Todus mexicanus]
SAELTEDQLLLLLESLDQKIVPQQLKLVREQAVLEHVEQGKERFGVESSLLPFSPGKEREVTAALLEMSGVTLQEDGSAACREEAFSAVAALYVCLYVLDLLSS